MISPILCDFTVLSVLTKRKMDPIKLATLSNGRIYLLRILALKSACDSVKLTGTSTVRDLFQRIKPESSTHCIPLGAIQMTRIPMMCSVEASTCPDAHV